MRYVPDAKPDERKFYLDELKSDGCHCGRPKQRGRSLCYRCYYKLPDDMRRALYRKIGNGYEAAYDAAIKFLEEI